MDCDLELGIPLHEHAVYCPQRPNQFSHPNSTNVRDTPEPNRRAPPPPPQKPCENHVHHPHHQHQLARKKGKKCRQNRQSRKKKKKVKQGVDRTLHGQEGSMDAGGAQPIKHGERKEKKDESHDKNKHDQERGQDRNGEHDNANNVSPYPHQLPSKAQRLLHPHSANPVDYIPPPASQPSQFSAQMWPQRNPIPSNPPNPLPRTANFKLQLPKMQAPMYERQYLNSWEDLRAIGILGGLYVMFVMLMLGLVYVGLI